MQELQNQAPQGANIEYTNDTVLDETNNLVIVKALGTGFIPGTALRVLVTITRSARDQYESFNVDGAHKVNEQGQALAVLNFPYIASKKDYYDFGVSVRAIGACQVKQHLVIVQTPLKVIEVPGKY